MNDSTWIELTHPVALFMLLTAIGLLLVIALLGSTVISAMDVYREKHIKKQLGKCFAAAAIVPALPNDMFATLAAVLILEVVVILALLWLLRFLTGISVGNKAWASTFILAGVLGYVWIFALNNPSNAATAEKGTVAAAPKAAEAPIDPANVPLLTDAADIQAGKQLFSRKCTACHGGNAKGTIGPNLTDDQWLHGGSPNEIFKTIKFGVPLKGMQAWEKQLSDRQIAQLTGFILSLQGS
ncbi:c-type cytochrome [Chitinophaga caseinilytica]|uniref:c-type cytochrome n=1 Tax=Chitinophaga caseinilytica TaxID=2267521 RepID=UPI003C2DA620